MASPLKNLLAQQASQLDGIGQKAVPPREFLTHVSALLSEGSPARSRGASAGSARRTPSTSPSKVNPQAAVVIAEQRAMTASPNSTVAAIPAAADAYMNELPLPPYGSTAHLSLHVTDTLELALRVLRKNAQVGRQLTDKDLKLLEEISAFKPALPVVENQGASPEGPTEPPTVELQDLMVAL